LSKCVEKIGSVQIFLEDDGTYTGYDFARGKYIPDPYKDKPPGYRPVFKVKTEEEIAAEIAEIADYQTVALPERKLRKESLEHFGIKIGLSEEDGITPEVHYYPYCKQGILQGYKVRVIESKKMWAIGSTKLSDLFGWGQAVAAGAKKLFITEGELDAVALYQICKDQNKGGKYEDYSPSVVSLTNGAGGAAKELTRLLPEIRKHFKEIVLVFDVDVPGIEAAASVVKVVPDAIVAELPSKDANQCLMDGRSAAAYKAVMFNAQKPKNTRLVMASAVAAEARQETPWGFSYPYPALTKLTRGQRLGETVYWGAGVKMGKSELLNDLVAHNIREHGWKVFVVKPEESNRRTLQGVVGKLVNRIFHDPEIPFDYEAFDKGVEELGDKLVMLNLYQELSWASLEADIRDAAVSGCKAIYIDPITVLSNGINAADANTLLQKFAQGLAQMALDLNVIVHIFCHLKSPDNGLSHERGGQVLSHQFAGSRAMMRACHAMIGMEGNKDPNLEPEMRNIRDLVLLEDRATGSTGKVKLYYDKATGAFNQIN
jgi:twinkle protein